VGGRAFATKYNRGEGPRTGVPRESNDATRMTIVRVPAGVATALARPGGSGTNGTVHHHNWTLATRASIRRGTGFWLALEGVDRDNGSRNGGEVRIMLLNGTDVESLVSTVVSRAVKPFYQSRQQLMQSSGIGSPSVERRPLERFASGG
jgi:hypothetical protein